MWDLTGSLNAVGAITRTVIGRPDEDASGYLKVLLKGTYDNHEGREYLEFLTKGILESEPDIFCYNHPEGSGKFVFDQEGNVLEVSVQEKADEKLIPPHRFTYYEPNLLPPRNTFGQDYWEFYLMVKMIIGH